MKKVIVITGGAQGIGKEMVDYFKNQGFEVAAIDVMENDYFVGDISKEEDLISFHKKVISQYGKIDYLVNNAMISRGGLNDCSYHDFLDVLKVGVLAPFMLVKLFMNDFNDKGAIVNISSSRAFMSQSNTEAYTAAKGGITALTHGMAVTLRGKVRVNSISPGWIDTSSRDWEEADADQHLVGRVGKPMDVVKLTEYLLSDSAEFIDGQNIIVDGGMSKQMIYHNDEGWTFKMS